MDDKTDTVRAVHNWSLDEITEDAPTGQVNHAGFTAEYLELSDDDSVKQQCEIGPIDDKYPLSMTGFTAEYLELSDDDSVKQQCEIGPIDTLGLEQNERGLYVYADLVSHEDQGLQVNSWDGLPYSTQYYELLHERQRLAIWRAKDDFVLAMDESSIVLVTGKAGSGKSTQIPQWCAHYAKETNFDFGTVVCAQPSSLPAMSLAIRVAREMDLTSIGNEVGYKVPFLDMTCDETLLKFCTDEMLLREMAEDPLLERYRIVIVDEVQERTVSTDMLLTLLRKVSSLRDTIKIVIISLPHEMPKLEEFFDEVPVVDLSYLDEDNGTYCEEENASDSVSTVGVCPQTIGCKVFTRKDRKLAKVHHKMINSLQSDFVNEAVEVVSRVHCDQSIDGDILLFLPGEKEINQVTELIVQDIAMKVLRGEAGDACVVSLYQTLPYGRQQAVYETKQPAPTTNENNLLSRKVIVCDNLAESSFSLGTIAVVIDSGRERLNGFEHVKAPPITRCELSTDVLLLKRLLQRLEIRFSSCQLLDPPAPDSYMQALEDLDYHGALDNNGELSDLGTVMSEFPLSLQLAKSVIASCGELCTQEMLTIASMLTVPTCYVNVNATTQMLAHPAGDHFTLLEIYDAFIFHKESEVWCKENMFDYIPLKLATKVRSALVAVMERLELPSSPRQTNLGQMEISVKKALLAGYFMQIAKDVDGGGNYLLVRDRHVARLSPTSTLKSKPEWVVFNEFNLSDNNFIITATEIDVRMVAEITPASYLANLPEGEIKTMIIVATEEIKDQESRNKTERCNVESLNTELRLGDDVASSSTSNADHHSRTHDEHTERKHCTRARQLQTYAYSGYREGGHPLDNRNTEGCGSTEEGVDILTQATRDLSHAYQKASNYLRNYHQEGDADDQSCALQ